MKLGNLQKATAVPDTLTWYVPNWNSKDTVPSIVIEPATTTNPRYMNARMAWEKSSEGQKIARNARNLALSALVQIREADYGVFAHLVHGWAAIVEDDGKAVEFPKADDPQRLAKIEEVLRALGAYNFDDLRNIVRNPERAPAGVEALAGN